MIVLKAADVLKAQADISAKVTVTGYGMTLSAGEEVFTNFGPTQVASTGTDLTTVAASTQFLLSSIVITNSDTTTAHTIAMWQNTATDAFMLLPIVILQPSEFAVYAEDGWHFYQSTGSLKTGTTGATGLTGPAVLLPFWGEDGETPFPLPGNTGPTGASGLGGVFTVGGLLTGAPPTTGFYMVFRAPFACTVTAVRSHFDAGTNVVVNARVNQTSTFMSSNYTNSTANAWGAGTVNQNTAIASGDDIEVNLVSLSGAVTKANIQVDLTRP